jgi:hypothetical protein
VTAVRARRIAMLIAPPLWSLAIMVTGFLGWYVVCVALATGFMAAITWLLWKLDRRLSDTEGACAVTDESMSDAPRCAD